MSFQQELRRIQRLCDRTRPKRRSRLTFAGGVLLSSALVFHLTPLAGFHRAGGRIPFQEPLWQSAGLVRQSIVDLYRIQRTQVSSQATPSSSQSSPPARSATALATAPATAEAPAAPPPPPSAPVPRPNAIDNALEIRVAIARDASSLEVGTSTSGWLVDTAGQQRCDLPQQQGFWVQPVAQQSLDVEGCRLAGYVWLEASNGGYVFLGDRWYRGRVLLLNDGGRLLAVNFVLLRDYLASVVGAEMYPDWPLEALKAQAVAARSYALTHHVRPASEHFDLDDTQRYQAYKGIAVETNTTQLAVEATAGEFISYQGGIVESLYAASDQIVQEAHGGQGMSQHGAKDFAAQGYTYQQILGTYYPGTSLSRLVVQ